MQIKLRKHQSDLNQCIDGIINQTPKFKNIKKIIISAVPGAGKGSVPVNAGKLVMAGLADAICVAVPRQSLQTQCEEVFMDPFFKKLFGVKLSVRASTNESNPCRGMNGFVTTYQALGHDKKKHVLHTIKNRRYVLIGDEPHHIAVDSPWYEAFCELVEAAKYVILMSGTLSRADGQKIAFMKYRNGYVDLSGDHETHVIKYTRSVALQEKAILPLRFHTYDTSTIFKTHTGKKKEYHDLRSVKKTDQSSALFTALETDFSDKLTDEALTHWLTYKKDHPDSKIIFVCARKADAERRTDYIKNLGIPALLATSHETKECIANIEAFKRHAPCLVAIAIPYEGLDVPPASHGCVLTRIRSNEWLEQFVSRFVRVHKPSGPYHKQEAHIFAPKDPKFLSFMEAVEKEQATKIKHTQEPYQLELFPIDEIEGGGKAQGPCIPIGSKIHELVNSVLGSKKISFERVVLTPKQEEKDVRRDIDRYLKRYAHDQGYEIQFVNREAKKINNKARKEMTLHELKKFFSEIQRHFPLKRTGSFIPISRCQPIFTDVGQKDFNINNENFF